MRFVTYKQENGRAMPGLLQGETVYGLPQYADLKAVIHSGNAAEIKPEGEGLPLGGVELLAPLLHPPRIFCVGLNYMDHASESKMTPSKVPTIFMKLASGIVGDGATVVLPSNSQEVDYEAELAVVIGKGGSHVTRANWQEYVFGYTALNDVSARDVQLATTQWTLGKSFPTFCPMGPCIVTADELGDPHALGVKLTIDGEVLQNGNTCDFLFDIPAVMEYISGIVPLEPGDIISTGTPPGVGLGRTPKRWLKDSEEMTIEIEGIGRLRNPVAVQRG
jgi:2-keto-4-pentenoate hydratase/2-oxohepta-3-ene-1,7-dioic acid hydratase in catechol pathway